MPLDLQALNLTQTVQLLNSTAAGPVCSDYFVTAHRKKAGFKIGDGQRINMLRYSAWLSQDLLRAQARPGESADDRRIRMAERGRLQSLAARDIGEIPAIKYPEERARGLEDPAFFCQWFFPGWFYKPFCEQHLLLLSEFDHVTRNGGLQAVALPRGRGKTAITKAMTLRAVLYALRRYVVWLPADEGMAETGLDTFWSQLRKNDRLIGAFPEVCYPLVCGGNDQRKKPLYRGQELAQGRKENLILFPEIAGYPTAGNIIQAAGLMTAVRGLHYAREDGTLARPDFVVLDDPQTDESAKSADQSSKREEIINQGILGMAAPGVKMTAIMPCTIIRPGDLSDRMLSRKLNPDWHGIVGRMLTKLPEHLDRWERYNQLRIKSLDDRHDISEATEFYAAHRAVMDAGCDATWPEEYNDDEISAIQHAMNLYFRNRAAFYAEYQNQPLRALDQAEQLVREDIIQRTNELARGVAPDAATVVTGFVDIHKDLLYWIVIAWCRDFSGQVLAYGVYPEQTESYFLLREARSTLTKKFPKASMQAAIQKGLHEVYSLMDQEWPVAGGGSIRLTMSAIDANWSQSTKAVDEFCAKSPWRGRIYPSHGRGIGPAEKPLKEWIGKKGDVKGEHWVVPLERNNRRCRHLVFDTNLWKSQTAELLLSQAGGPASLVLHAPEGPFDHRLLADHWCSESREPTWGRGRTVDIWKLPPAIPDNHWFDCVVGATMMASVCGVQIPLTTPARATKKKKKRSRVHSLKV